MNYIDPQGTIAAAAVIPIIVTEELLVPSLIFTSIIVETLYRGFKDEAFDECRFLRFSNAVTCCSKLFNSRFRSGNHVSEPGLRRSLLRQMYGHFGAL